MYKISCSSCSSCIGHVSLIVICRINNHDPYSKTLQDIYVTLHLTDNPNHIVFQKSLSSWPGTHPEIFKRGGLNFSKSNQYPIVVNAVIVKQGFVVIVASLQHLFISKPCNNDFESCWL